ncbi:MAG TPA: class I SAM-dependent methyltransferase [Candidatus Binatia bacterium]|jgi:SAM-dependent methyltransferase
MSGTATEGSREIGHPAIGGTGEGARQRLVTPREAVVGDAGLPVRVDTIRTFDPRELLGDRLGLSLYCRFAQDHLAGQDGLALQMYEQFIAYFNEQREHSAARFKVLIDGLRSGGFDPTRPVYANPREHTLKNGSHRVATAIALGLEQIPYNLSFEETRTPNEVFPKIFASDQLASLLAWQDELIEQCGGLTTLRCRVRRLMRQHPQSFSAAFSSKTKIPVARLYQGHEKLGLLGKRPTEKRFAAYGLGQYLQPHMSVLEMGCNDGFLSIEIAERVRSVTSFDVDAAYVAIGKMVSAHLGRTNTDFRVSSFEQFADARTFDAVVACAVHGWVSVSFQQFVTKILGFLAPGGLLLLESHELDCHPEWAEQRRLLLEHFEVLRSGLIDDVDGEMYASEMREYLVLRRKSAVGG